MSEHSSAALPTSLFSVLGQLLGQSTSTSASEVTKKRKRSNRSNNDAGYKVESSQEQDATTDYIDLEEDTKGKEKDESVTNRQKKRAKGDQVLSITSVIDDTVLMEEQESVKVKSAETKEEEGREEEEEGRGSIVKQTMSTSRTTSSISIPPPKHPLNPHAVYITGIAYTTLVSDGLADLFSSLFGPVKEARVAVKDGKGRGFGYVLFQSPHSATACLKRFSVQTNTTSSKMVQQKTTSKMEEEEEEEEDKVDKDNKNERIQSVIPDVLSLDGRVLQVLPCRRDLIDKWHVPALPPRPVLINTATITSFKPRGFSRVQMKINTSSASASASTTSASTTSVKANVTSIEATLPSTAGSTLLTSALLSSSADDVKNDGVEPPVVDEVIMQ